MYGEWQGIVSQLVTRRECSQLVWFREVKPKYSMATSKSASYDYLIKLLLIGDSGYIVHSNKSR